MGPEPYIVADSWPLAPGARNRFWLRRRWAPGGYTAVIIGLNPSTAAGAEDDVTIRKEVGFCKRNHLNGFTKVNLFSYRATDPQQLLSMDEQQDEFDENIEAILNAFRTPYVSHIICAWGAATGHRRHLVDNRVQELIDSAVFSNRMLWSFGTTAEGYPRHTSRLAYDTPLVPWQFVKTAAQFPRPMAEVAL